MYVAMHDLVDKNAACAGEALRNLLTVRSVLEESGRSEEHPFGLHVTEALDRYLALAREMGFAIKNIDNMAGYAEIGSGPLFGILVHLDVVPEGRSESWRYPPFAGTIADGRIYGRGAIDDKGPAVAALFALKALADSGTKLKRRYRVIAGLDEESGMRCMKRYRETEEIPENGFSPDSRFPVVNAEKGILHFALSKKIANMTVSGVPEITYLRGGTKINVVPDEVTACFDNVSAGGLEYFFRHVGGDVRCVTPKVSAVRVRGVTAHASEPWKGENAIHKMLAALANMDFGPFELHMELIKLMSMFKSEVTGASLGIASEDDISGPLSCNLAKIELCEDTIRAECDIRYPVKESGEAVIARLEEASSSIGWTMEVLFHDAPLFVEPDSPLVRTLLSTYEKITGEPGSVMSSGGGTYSRVMPGVVSFGPHFPGEEMTMHQANEYISLESMRRMTHVYAEALARMNDLP